MARLFDKNGQPLYQDYVEGKPLPENAVSVMPFFPGYTFEGGKSMYRGEEVGEGGYVYAEPGMYGNVALLDIASMHPSSIMAEELFREKYTERFGDILNARIAIKHKDFDAARKMLGGKLAKYLDDENAAGDLAQALKIAINSVYGLTSATFDNPFRDNRNKDNIVAKRGALFMVNLKHAVWEKGYRVAHIKTDSIKIPDATPEIIRFVNDYGREYGYNFEHEATYERMTLVNDAVYIARYDTKERCEKRYGYSPKDCIKHGGEWTATGTQFAVPYVFKTLFTHEDIAFDDMCETKSVSSALYLDMNENPTDVSRREKALAMEVERVKKPNEVMGVSKLTDDEEQIKIMQWLCANVGKTPNANNKAANTETPNAHDKANNTRHDYHFVGKVGRFCPMKDGFGGGLLLRETKNKKTGEKGYAAATGSKGYRWMESDMVKTLGKEDGIDRGYYNRMVDEAVKSLSEHGDFEWFISDDPYIPVEHPEDRAPWE